MLPDSKKLLILTGVAIAILLVTTIAAITTTIIVLRNQKPPTPAPVTSTAESAPIATPPNQPSKFASDAGLLKLQNKVKNLSGKVDSIDLFEPEITPPNLDLNIRIN